MACSLPNKETAIKIITQLLIKTSYISLNIAALVIAVIVRKPGGITAMHAVSNLNNASVLQDKQNTIKGLSSVYLSFRWLAEKCYGTVSYWHLLIYHQSLEIHLKVKVISNQTC